jgi:hypothetical protein
MKKIDGRVKIGTKVKINEKWYDVRAINDTRINLKVEGLAGSFQQGHIETFTNKGR